MKVTLIQCPVWGTYDPPLALAQLPPCLKAEGHEVSTLDMNIELYHNRREGYKDMWAWEQSIFWYNPELVIKFFSDNQDIINQYISKINESNAQAICFSVTASSRLASLELARLVKKRNKDIPIIFGGTLFFEESWIESVLRDTAVDIIVYGEGEVTACELVRLLEEGKSLDSCLGIAFKKNGIVLRNPARPLIKNLDILPPMDFSNLPLSNYDDSHHIPFLASRGCVQQCAFCSSKVFWPGYRSMSGKRIFDEIAFQNENNTIGHIDFVDLMFNGNIKELISFCELMIKADFKKNILWTANAIIRPEMTTELLKKMKVAGCKHLIYGIESGSQRVLDLMNKRFKIKDADEVIRATHEAGIVVTTNFMFGFPGEEESDFMMTLDFVKRNAKYLDRVYPSRTFCAIEEFSYLYGHMEKFGVKPNPPDHLYWETTDGRNIYPERLRRCEEFCKLAAGLGIEVACGVQTSLELDRWFNLANYYGRMKDIGNAIDCCLKYYALDQKNEMVKGRIIHYFKEIEKNNNSSGINEELLLNLRDTVNLINMAGNEGVFPAKRLENTGRKERLVLLKSDQRDNLELNDIEFEEKKTMLRSSPKTFFLQLSGPCNSSCVFCSRGRDYEIFDLETYRRRFEEKISFYLHKAEKIVFTGSGEFLLLEESKKILDYFDNNFPHVDKMFSTNGLGLTPDISEKIARSQSRYTIHVSMHASNSRLHQTLTRTDTFHKVLGQLQYLLGLRRETGNPEIYFIFVATTLNIEDLPKFIKLASTLGVSKVICYYNYIYVPAQKYLSCFFKKDLTNRMFDEAANTARQLNISLELPPRFDQDAYPVFNVCREPWSQIMFNINGHVLPCDASEDCKEDLGRTKWFSAIWNSDYYINLRKSLIKGENSCFKHCFRANPKAVNDFLSHVIRRGKDASDIDISWGDNF
jgi:wyosine [tRNA(Phe)-imidazoG37] synthetase (radical SAM superfamily)